MTTSLFNTLYVQTQGAYVHLDHEALAVEVDGERRLKMPLIHVGGLAVFGNVLVSPFLVHRFAQDGRSLNWFSESGRFQARLSGPVSGNVLLRRAQHEAAASDVLTLELARRFVKGKIRNARAVLARARRERPEAAAGLQAAAKSLTALKDEAQAAGDVNALRGVEGQAAAVYFQHFDRMLLPGDFRFSGRVKRPPRDPVNALLSFCYALLSGECVAACEGVGLDPQCGFLHALRPGRPSLALDLMEEFRPWFADRLVLRLLNLRQLRPGHFQERPGGSVRLTDEGRKLFLTAYQERKRQTVHHPLLDQEVALGLLPHVQARLLARRLRGDLAAYAPYAWR